jgi:hypothetical protein
MEMQLPERNPHFRPGAGHMFAIIFFIITGGYLMAIPVAAHPPSDMSVSSHEITRTLMVTITHQVPDPQESFYQRSPGNHQWQDRQ